MAVGKEILGQITSIQNTQKITKAMEMVSTSKIRKTQERMKKARPYSEKVQEVMTHLAQTHADHGVKLLEMHREIKRAGFILITTDKGLCGGLNANALKIFLAKIDEYRELGVEVDVVCIGSKGYAACQRIGLNVVAKVINIGDSPKMEVILGSIIGLFDHFEKRELDIIHLVYSNFINTMKQESRLSTLLPISHTVIDTTENTDHFSWDYVYEPSPSAVLEYLVRRYLESVVYQALCENLASEQAARMVAMKAATDNASNAIKQLKLVYNKSRQAAITTELSEIVAGAAAV